MKRFLLTAAILLLPLLAGAQQVLSLEECRQMALQSNKTLEQQRTQVEMAGYDRKIARAQYFPDVTGIATYQWLSADLALINDDASKVLTTGGTMANEAVLAKIQELSAQYPAVAAVLAQEPHFQALMQKLTSGEIAGQINAIGSEIDDVFHPDIHNIYLGGVMLKQPVFVGGKIIAANRVARLAEELARTRYTQEYQQVVVDVDQAYWQIVSIAGKKRLAQSYADLLHHMEKDVALAVQEGVSTESDALQIKVKANEADMMLTKATNGLTLSKMLLCKQIGLPLDSEIVLADEESEVIPVPEAAEGKTMEEIYAARPETHMLDLAAQIYDGKAKMVRADLMPQIALTAGYIVTNPNLQNGFQKTFAGTFNAGVIVRVPIFHGFEVQNKTRKAMAEATLYRSKLEDAKNMINLQVTQLYKQQQEAFEHLRMAESNLSHAEENMRKSTVGFEAGVVEANTALAAHTAWLQAHSEYIDAGIELQMNLANIQKAEGTITE